MICHGWQKNTGGLQSNRQFHSPKVHQMPACRNAGTGTSYEDMEYRWDNKQSRKTHTFCWPSCADERTREKNVIFGDRSWHRRHHPQISMACHLRTSVLVERHYRGYKHTPGRHKVTWVVHVDTQTINMKNTYCDGIRSRRHMYQ